MWHPKTLHPGTKQGLCLVKCYIWSRASMLTTEEATYCIYLELFEEVLSHKSSSLVLKCCLFFFSTLELLWTGRLKRDACAILNFHLLNLIACFHYWLFLCWLDMCHFFRWMCIVCTCFIKRRTRYVSWWWQSVTNSDPRFPKHVVEHFMYSCSAMGPASLLSSTT